MNKYVDKQKYLDNLLNSVGSNDNVIINVMLEDRLLSYKVLQDSAAVRLLPLTPRSRYAYKDGSDTSWILNYFRVTYDISDNLIDIVTEDSYKVLFEKTPVSFNIDTRYDEQQNLMYEEAVDTAAVLMILNKDAFKDIVKISICDFEFLVTLNNYKWYIATKVGNVHTSTDDLEQVLVKLVEEGIVNE